MRLTLLFILLSFQSFSQVNYSSITVLDVQQISRSYLKQGRVTQEMRELYPINALNGVEYVSFIGKTTTGFTATSLEQEGIIIGSEINDIVSIKCPINKLNTLISSNDLTYLKIAGKIKPLLDRVHIGVNADSVWNGINLPEGYSGKDVIIGITDWGFDYSHPMFYDTLLQNTRVLAAWDQFKTSGPTPSNYAYGTEYNTVPDLMAAGADTANFYSFATHGSHVAGIAGGGGAGLPNMKGMAFESEYLFVTFQFDEASVLDAWEWMYNKADGMGKRLVVNMSWGIYHMGAPDGTDLLEQALDSYSDLGVVFVSSAGNNGDVNFHIEKDFTNDTIATKIDFYWSSTLASHWGQSIHMWGEAGNEFSSQVVVTDAAFNELVVSPWYSTASTPTYVDTFVVTGIDTVFYNLAADNIYPSNGRPQTRLRVKYPPASVRVGIRSTALSGKVHYWNLTELSTDAGNWGMPFANFGAGSTTGDNNYGIGVPTCANSAITVAAYNSEFLSPSGTMVGGAEVGFSSEGPLMDGTLKPDVAAPGVNVTSSISSYTDASFSEVTSVFFNGRTYPFAKFSGTSMSSPATAGVVALILDANPYLSPAQVKDVLIQTARKDNHTGAIPPHSVKWGWGKVDAYSAIQMALTLVGTVELEVEQKWQVFPNPTTSMINVSGIIGKVDDIRIVNMLGQSVVSVSHVESIDVSSLNAGTYFLRIVVDGKVEQVKFVKY
ncbi:MAG: S8 family peptidase [Crocinitomicaceae bacterium]|nr:S8 family peptidase [Crocinitomicaceae bacterium]